MSPLNVAYRGVLALVCACLASKPIVAQELAVDTGQFRDKIQKMKSLSTPPQDEYFLNAVISLSELLDKNFPRDYAKHHDRKRYFSIGSKGSYIFIDDAQPSAKGDHVTVITKNGWYAASPSDHQTVYAMRIKVPGEDAVDVSFQGENPGSAVNDHPMEDLSNITWKRNPVPNARIVLLDPRDQDARAEVSRELKNRLQRIKWEFDELYSPAKMWHDRGDSDNCLRTQSAKLRSAFWMEVGLGSDVVAMQRLMEKACDHAARAERAVLELSRTEGLAAGPIEVFVEIDPLNPALNEFDGAAAVALEHDKETWSAALRPPRSANSMDWPLYHVDAAGIATRRPRR